MIQRCARCHKMQVLRAFPLRGRVRAGRSAWCRVCKNSHSRRYGKTYRQGKVNTRKRPWYMLKYQYGLTETEYLRVLKTQGGVCAICRGPSRIKNGQQERYQFDHDHQTGKFRGLLCHMCNAALGLCRDDPRILRSMVQYLTA